jgi:hypothetical protein
MLPLWQFEGSHLLFVWSLTAKMMAVSDGSQTSRQTSLGALALLAAKQQSFSCLPWPACTHLTTNTHTHTTCQACRPHKSCIRGCRRASTNCMQFNLSQVALLQRSQLRRCAALHASTSCHTVQLAAAFCHASPLSCVYLSAAQAALLQPA